MKLQKKFLVLAIMSAASVCTVAHAATLVHAVGVNNQTTSTSSFITSWVGLGVDGNASSGSLTGIAGSVGGEAFTYDITITIKGVAENFRLTNVNSLLGRTNTGQTDNGFRNTEGFDLTISNISNVNVQFDGFVQISHGNTTDGQEGASINGTDYLRSGGTVNALDPVVTASTLEWRSIADNDNNGVAARYIDFQFSEAIPEPSSAVLLGLSGLALIARRRRA
jgi:opacity protein-like surface antigen